jgi:Flp pilus assembly protein TadG
MSDGPNRDRSKGSVTAEFAVLLPGLALLLGVVLGAGSAAAAQLRCIDAARSAARLAARHESASVVLAAGHSAGPAGSSVQVSESGDLVRVEVRAQVPLPLPGRPTIGVAAASVAPVEGSSDGAGSR